MPGFRGTPAGMRMTSAPVKASRKPDGVGSYPLTVLLVLIWLTSAATPVVPVNCGFPWEYQIEDRVSGPGPPRIS